MNGNKYLLDTNILLYVTGGKLDISSLPDGEFHISFVSELEVLSYPTITPQEEEQLRHFLGEIPIIAIPREIKKQAIVFRKKYRLKLPDAIIAATAHHLDATLITNDSGLAAVSEIKIRSVDLKRTT